MTLAERRKAAAQRLAAVAAGQNPYAQEEAPQTNQRSEDSAIDRGLIAWWE